MAAHAKKYENDEPENRLIKGFDCFINNKKIYERDSCIFFRCSKMDFSWGKKRLKLRYQLPNSALKH